MSKPLDAASYAPPSPHFFCGRGTVLATHANLPHWNKVNTAAFVTFRLADSLPKEKLLTLEAQRTDWITAHPQPWDDATVREYFESFDLRVQEWLDRGMGSCVLADSRCRAIVEDALWHFAGERYALYAYVVMPNHVHVLFMPTGDFQIRDLTASWKRFTARQINSLLNQDGALWQKESFDTLVRSDRHFNAIIRYIKKNDLNKAWCFIR